MINLVKDIIKFLHGADDRITQTAVDIWNLDYRDDILDFMTARELTSTYIDQTKNIRIYHENNVSIYLPHVRPIG